MTLLRGHFAMTLIAAVDAPSHAIQERLKPVAESGLVVAVLELPAVYDGADGQQRFVLTVHGGDRPGIVSAVTRRIADIGGNITDLSTRLAGGFYVLVAEVQLPIEHADEALQALRETAGTLGVTVHFTAVDEDVM
jgi:glycine cleavage system transcriptional repressor